MGVFETIQTVNNMEWYYDHNADNSERYSLGNPGKKPLVCFGINPSTATPEELDPTLKRVRNRSSKENGFRNDRLYDGWIMFNVYPFRATDPKLLPVERVEESHTKNLSVIAEILEKNPCSDIWAAWGGIIKQRKYLSECLYDIVDVVRYYECNWYSIGPLSKNGKHPHHPLYLKSSYVATLFDMEEYIKSLKR